MSGPLLRVEGVWKTYHAHPVLRGVDLDVAPHEVVCLIGASGSGKSTLLRCVNVLETVDDGAILLEGDDITDPIVFQKMATDDTWLKGLSDQQFYVYSRKLSQSDAEQMALRRGKLLNGEINGKGPNDLDTGTVNGVLNNRLQQLAIDPTPKDGTADAQRVGAIRQFVWKEVLQAQKAAHRIAGKSSAS